jgi:Ca2+-binding EF-hand superfamily protein
MSTPCLVQHPSHGGITMKSIYTASACAFLLLLPLSAAAQQSPATSRPLVGGHGNNVEAFIAQYDADADGKVSWDEFEAQRRQRYTTTDADGSGIVDVEEYVQEYNDRSRKELERGRTQQAAMTSTRFAALDADNNLQISRSEFAASGDKQYAGFLKMPVPQDTSREGRTAEGAARFDRRPGGPLGMPTSHTREGFLQLYDSDGDGEVERTEYDQARAAQFARTDTDGDGELSADEYYVEYEDRVERRIALLADDSDKQTRIRFGALDADKDGKLTWSEYQASGKRTFDRADRGHDGTVDAGDAKLPPPPPPRPQRSSPADTAAPTTRQDG